MVLHQRNKSAVLVGHSYVEDMLGLSLAACSRIRAGARVPHRRHWDRLLTLVEAGN